MRFLSFSKSKVAQSQHSSHLHYAIFLRLRLRFQIAIARKSHSVNGAYRTAQLKLLVGPEKLINSTLFAAGGNNTLDLISN